MLLAFSSVLVIAGKLKIRLLIDIFKYYMLLLNVKN